MPSTSAVPTTAIAPVPSSPAATTLPSEAESAASADYCDALFSSAAVASISDNLLLLFDPDSAAAAAEALRGASHDLRSAGALAADEVELALTSAADALDRLSADPTKNDSLLEVSSAFDRLDIIFNEECEF